MIRLLYSSLLNIFIISWWILWEFEIISGILTWLIFNDSSFFCWYAFSGMSDRLVNAVTGVCLMSHGGLIIMYRGVSPHSILPIINFSIILPLCSIIITFLFILIGRHWHVNFIESLPKSFIGIVFYSSSLYYCESV